MKLSEPAGTMRLVVEPGNDALPLVVSTDDGTQRFGPTEAELRALVGRIGGVGDRFVIVERVPGSAECFVQTWRAGTSPYVVEFWDGSADRHFHIEVDDPDLVASLLVDWAPGNEQRHADPDWQPLRWEVNLPAETRQEAERFARELIPGGFTTHEQVAVGVTEYCAPDEKPVSMTQAQAIVDRPWRERSAEQASWPETTDADRLLAVVDTLNANGIVARSNFACCRNCGMLEIRGEAEEGARGFMFFHQQDTATAATGGGMLLVYGSMPGSPEDTVAVGREVAAALTAGRLPVMRNDSADTRIRVMPLDGKKRSPPDYRS